MMFKPDPTRFTHLEDLLCELFRELRPLRIFVRNLPDSERMVEVVTIDRGTIRQAAEALVEVLTAQNRADGTLFDALVEEYPKRARDIRAVQHKWQEIVLFLSANPGGMAALEGVEEARKVKAAIEAVQGGGRIGVVVHHDTDVDAWRRQIEMLSPTIVHFSGHGNIAGRLMLEDGDAATDLPPGPMLAQLQSVGVSGIVLGACHSDRLARAAVNAGVPWAIGMHDAVLDDVAVAFASAFYEGWALGKAAREAYEWALADADWQALPRPSNPKFFPPESAATPDATRQSGTNALAGPSAPTPPQGDATRTAPVRDLEDLLVLLFVDNQDLRRFLARSEDLADLADRVPTQVAPRDAGERVAELLGRYGLIDQHLFELLLAARPEAAGDISKVARAAGLEVAPAPPNVPAPPTSEEIEAGIRACVAANRPVVVRVVTWPNEHPGPAATFRLECPANALYVAGFGERYIGGPIEEIGRTLSRISPATPIEIIPQCTPATATRVGQALKRVTQARVYVHARNLSGELVPPGPVNVLPQIELPKTARPLGVALLIAINQKSVFDDFGTWSTQRQQPHPLQQVLVTPPTTRPAGTCLHSAAEASAWGAAIGDAVRDAKNSEHGPVHVFGAAPGPLMIAIGQNLHRIGRVTLWDWDPAATGYRASYTFDT